MKSVGLVATLLAGLALATPVKRDLVTEWDIKTVTVYVTASRSRHHSHIHTNTPAAVVPTVAPTVEMPTIVPTVAAPSSTSSSVAVIISPASSSTSSSVAVIIKPSNSPAPDDSSDGVDYSSLSAYAVPILKQHNLHRTNHSVPALQWDNDLANVARQIAETCVYAHSNAAGDGNYGQNIGAGTPDDEVDKMITNAMYNAEYDDYPGYGGEPDMSNFHEWGHFSQIVWKNTKVVGCYTKKCGSLANVGSRVKPYFTVCNYKPAGNFGGQYGANVLKPIGMDTVVV